MGHLSRHAFHPHLPQIRSLGHQRFSGSDGPLVDAFGAVHMSNCQRAAGPHRGQRAAQHGSDYSRAADAPGNHVVEPGLSFRNNVTARVGHADRIAGGCRAVDQKSPRSAAGNLRNLTVLFRFLPWFAFSADSHPQHRWPRARGMRRMAPSITALLAANNLRMPRMEPIIAA